MEKINRIEMRTGSNKGGARLRCRDERGKRVKDKDRDKNVGFSFSIIIFFFPEKVRSGRRRKCLVEGTCRATKLMEYLKMEVEQAGRL